MPFRAVHFGAGNIGRGFLGQLYWESSFEICFVDVDVELVDALHMRRSYPLRLVGAETQQLEITGVEAVPATNANSVADAMLHADILSTAVGAGVLPRLGTLIAHGLEKRYSRANAAPLNILVCENHAQGDTVLRDAVMAALSPRFHDVVEARVGFVMASIGRMVPVMTAAQRAEDPLLVCVEPFCELPVDADAIKGFMPPIRHLQLKQHFVGYTARKLYVHNLSHAAVAYLGHLCGHEYTWQAVEDARVRARVAACTAESITAIHRAHGLELAELEAHAEDLLQRYANRALGDTVARVARDPIRKLGRTDRIIGAGLLCVEQGVPVKALAFTAAAAMRYDAGDDPAAAELQRIKSEGGIPAVLTEICGIPPDSALGKAIIQADSGVNAFLDEVK